jgi:hypothetical protein
VEQDAAAFGEVGRRFFEWLSVKTGSRLDPSDARSRLATSRLELPAGIFAGWLRT